MPDHPSLEDAPFTDDELDLYLAGGDPDGHAARWSVNDLGSAEWAMGRLADALDEIDALDAQAAAWRARVDEWLTESAAKPRRFAEFLTSELTRFGLELRAANPKATTTKVPSGKVATRKVDSRPVIASESAVLEWLDERDDVPEGAISRKPLVSKIRPLISIVGRATGRLLVDVGCCGARLTISDDDLVDGAKVGLCSNCGAVSPRVTASTEEVVLVPVDHATGEIIPGVIVEPLHFTATITPNRG